ncbi:hypothetical protein H0H93_001157 [Arthromyces matolae]|nr:hypothetical protein H0H93_001157 [Arthromyces matolae]
MFPVQSRGSHSEAYALRPLQNNEPTPSTTECPVITLDAPAPEMHCSKDRTRRLSRASTRDQPPLSATISISAGVNQARQQKIAFLHLAALYCALFGSGWNDGSSGPLIPTFQSHYNVRQTQLRVLNKNPLNSSADWLPSCLAVFRLQLCGKGFIIGSGLNIYLDGKIGFGKCVVIGTTLQLTSYIIQAPGPAFPLMAFANFITGFGLSLLNSQANGFVSSLSQNMETKLAFLHASYGLGAFTSPLVATYFSNQRHWSFHYIISACLAACNTVALILVFHLKRIDVLLEESGQASEDNSNPAPSQNTYRQVFSLHAVHFLTLFALIYIGVEVTLGGTRGSYIPENLSEPYPGWIVTFIIRERGGGHSSGYISSGFFGGWIFFTKDLSDDP